MKLHEITDDEMPLIWLMVRKLRNNKKRVDFAGMIDSGTSKQYVHGEIMWPHQERVDIYAHGRNWVYRVQPDDDERFNLEEIKSEGGSYYRVVEA